jgi:hypothetical protein
VRVTPGQGGQDGAPGCVLSVDDLYEALLFRRCVSYSLDLAFLAIFFSPLFFICVNLRSSAVRLCFHSRHFASIRGFSSQWHLSAVRVHLVRSDTLE